ncbi:MAG: hypothetical protein IH865_08035 [Chloroflexi bacterium]|nr:hypothetical protein [Chloroflexota bacterium]
MDTFNWMVLEMITREQVQERLNGHQLELPKVPKRQNPITRMLASSLVRLGLRLDPAAGEGLGRLDLSLGHTEGRN